MNPIEAVTIRTFLPMEVPVRNRKRHGVPCPPSQYVLLDLTKLLPALRSAVNSRSLDSPAAAGESRDDKSKRTPGRGAEAPLYPNPSRADLAAASAIFGQRVTALAIQDGAELSVAAIVFGEVRTISLPQRTDESVAPLVTNLTIAVPTAIIQPCVAILRHTPLLTNIHLLNRTRYSGNNSRYAS